MCKKLIKIMFSNKYSIQESSKLIQIIVFSIILWVIALILSMAYMAILGINPQEETFGLNHPKYWNFEILMTPSYIIIGLLILIAYYKFYIKTSSNWIIDSFLIGLIIMLIQFILDLIVIVGLFQNSLDYFFALVTVSYLLIPFWSVLSKWITLRI